MEIADKAVLVTGGSRGLGAALGRAFAARGGRVALLARGEGELARMASEIRDSRGGEVHAISADVGDKRAIYAVAGQVAALIGPPDIVVHNASTLGPTPLPLLLDTECEDFARVLEVNLLGPFRLTKALAGHMLVRGHGLVVSHHRLLEAFLTPQALHALDRRIAESDYRHHELGDLCLLLPYHHMMAESITTSSSAARPPWGQAVRVFSPRK